MVIKKLVVVFKLLSCCVGAMLIFGFLAVPRNCGRLLADSGTLLCLGLLGSFRPVVNTVSAVVKQ